MVVLALALAFAAGVALLAFRLELALTVAFALVFVLAVWSQASDKTANAAKAKSPVVLRIIFCEILLVSKHFSRG